MRILIPTIGRLTRLRTCLESLASQEVNVSVLHDGEAIPYEPYENLKWSEGYSLDVHWIGVRGGYWRALNFGLKFLERDELFFYGANDLEFDPSFVKNAKKYEDDPAPFVSCKSNIWGDFHASHAWIKMKTLWVLYGHYEFPEYDHHFADGELTERAKELGIYTYDSTVRFNHSHYSHPSKEGRDKDYVDELGSLRKRQDFDRKRRRYTDWVREGKNEAARRLHTIN